MNNSLFFGKGYSVFHIPTSNEVNIFEKGDTLKILCGKTSSVVKI